MRREGEGEVALWNGQRAGGTRGGGLMVRDYIYGFSLTQKQERL